jgi:hypothetical protein
MAGGSPLFEGRRAVLLTKHRKEQVIQPILEKAMGCQIVVEAGFDTDQFGTFTREISRPGSQLDVARLKAEKGMELAGVDLGLASEGSFDAHPLLPFVPWNVELVLLVDKKERLELCGQCANSETNYSHRTIASWPEAEEFARQAGFPEHWLVLRPDNEQHQSVVKGLNTWEHLQDAVRWALATSASAKAFLETDMRAHANPTRMRNIQKAAADLAGRITQHCPACATPGFSVTGVHRGLPCEECGCPTEEVKARVFTCKRCGFSRTEEAAESERAPAGRCPHCNP